MAANVETMFSVREVPWHGLGTIIEDAPNVEDAIRLAGLDWNVVQKDLYFPDNCFTKISGFKVNVRETDQSVLGIVTDRYQVLQNSEAFAFADALLGEGVKFETAGSLANGKRNFILARIPDKFKILDDTIEPYLVISNSHDGSSAVKVAMTPVRVVCQNTLNLALKQAKRTWMSTHSGDIQGKLIEAQETLQLGNQYMGELVKECEKMNSIKFSDSEAEKMIKNLIPVKEDATGRTKANALELQLMLMQVYKATDDLQNLNRGAYRFINAVSDFATHRPPKRNTGKNQEMLFGRVIDGLALIDNAYKMVMAR